VIFVVAFVFSVFFVPKPSVRVISVFEGGDADRG
jgi:hypothetical protein